MNVPTESYMGCIHSVYGAGFWTISLLIVSRLSALTTRPVVLNLFKLAAHLTEKKIWPHTLIPRKISAAHQHCILLVKNGRKFIIGHYFTILKHTWRLPPAHFCAPAEWLRTTALDQRFSTWGTRTPGGTCGVCRGYAKFQIYSKLACTSLIFTKKLTNHLKISSFLSFLSIKMISGVIKGYKLWFGGYAEGFKSDLGGTRVSKGWEPLH